MFQCKIDKMVLFHAVAKSELRYPGGTPLKRALAIYVKSRRKKYKVHIYNVQLYYKMLNCTLVFFIQGNLMINQ